MSRRCLTTSTFLWVFVSAVPAPAQSWPERPPEAAGSSDEEAALDLWH